MNDLSSYQTRNLVQRTAVDADQAEFKAYVNGSTPAYSGIYDDVVADALDDFDASVATPDPEGPDWVTRDLQEDNAVGALLERLEERQQLMTGHYPFEVDKGNIKYSKSSTLVYEFCLKISNTNITSEDADLTKNFEQVSRILVQSYLGDMAESQHTGWPRRPGSPTRFRELMEMLHEKTGEWWWGPEDDLPKDPDPSVVKDEGVDFVTWIPSPDNRAGKLFFVGQCACGQNWQDKFNDINIEKMKKWFHPMTVVDPVRVFCTPHHVTNGLLKHAEKQAGIVFDRIRLSILAEKSDEAIKHQIESLNISGIL